MVPTLKREHLTGNGACEPGVSLFDAHSTNGQIEYTAETDALLIAKNKGFRDWLVSKRLIPRYSVPYGDGDGYGDGYGDGSGDGSGDGYGYGYGDGDGYGDGYGDGSGDGSGYGYGSGSGSGYGYGDGSGDGYGDGYEQ